MNMEDLFTKECGILEIQADPVILGDCVKIKVCVVDGKIHAGDDVEWLSHYPKAYQKAKIESIHSDDGSINRAAEGMTVDILLSGNRQAKYLQSNVNSPFLRCLSNPLKGLLERKKGVVCVQVSPQVLHYRHSKRIDIINYDRKATTIVDKDGNFAHCVPIHHKAAIEQFLTTGSMKPTVQYGLKITVESNYTYKVDWQIQEEGGEVDGKPTKSIWLYSFIDRYGNFSAPFRIYSIGKVVFYRKKPELELERNGGVLPDELVKQIYADL